MRSPVTGYISYSALPFSMENIEQNPTKTGEEVVIRDEKGKFVEGHPPMGGRPKGRRDFNTLFDESIERIVKELKIPVDDPEKEMAVKAVVEAMKGNFKFYKDIMDRRYGKPVQPMDVKQSGEIKTTIGVQEVAEIAKQVSEEIKKRYTDKT